MRDFFEEKVEPVLAEPMEVITHLAPHLAALAYSLRIKDGERGLEIGEREAEVI